MGHWPHGAVAPRGDGGHRHESPLQRLGAGILGLAGLALAVGHGASWLSPPNNPYARVSLGAGFWVLLLTLSLLVTDALARQRLMPSTRVLALALTVGAVALLLGSGAWNELSVMREYVNRADSFWREGATHVLLSVGSLAAATAVGLPLGSSPTSGLRCDRRCCNS